MTPTRTIAMILGGSVMLLGICAGAGAQDLGSLTGMAGGSDLSSIASGSAGNAAGVIEFCVKNNYLGGDAASSVKDQLMGKLGGDSESQQDKSDYADGANGLVKTGDGNSVDLAKIGGMKKSLTKKACASVLDHAKSLL
jgi:hypothetical protein